MQCVSQMVDKIVYYIKALFVPRTVIVWNGDEKVTYTLIVYRNAQGDWKACYSTQDTFNIFSHSICEVVTTSKDKAKVATFNMLKEEYRWRRHG